MKYHGSPLRDWIGWWIVNYSEKIAATITRGLGGSDDWRNE